MPYPTLLFDYGNPSIPALADNIWHAQMAGCPKVLTYSGPDVTIRRATRHAAMQYDDNGGTGEIPRILSRDEYPFACTLEGGGSSFVGHVPGRENSVQGGMIAAFLRKHEIVAGMGERSKFIIAVVNHPNGPVTSTCRPVCTPMCTAEQCRSLTSSRGRFPGFHGGVSVAAGDLG